MSRLEEIRDRLRQITESLGNPEVPDSEAADLAAEAAELTAEAARGAADQVERLERDG